MNDLDRFGSKVPRFKTTDRSTADELGRKYGVWVRNRVCGRCSAPFFTNMKYSRICGNCEGEMQDEARGRRDASAIHAKIFRSRPR